jgi:site-specific recombinase XerD
LDDGNLPKGLLKPGYRKVATPPARWIAWFDELLRTAGKASSTRRIYRVAVARWLTCCADPMRPSRDELLYWLRSRRQHIGQAALNQELSALRAFYGFSQRFGYCNMDVKDYLPPARKLPKKLPRHLTDWQVGQVLASPDLSTFTGFRDHVIMRLLYECGPRAGELIALRIDDLVDDRVLRIGGRLCPMSETLHQLLQDWLALRYRKRPGKCRALFITSAGRPFASAHRVWKIVDRHARAALGQAQGYTRIRQTPWRGYYPSQLRHGLAVAMLERGVDLRAVQELLGHASIATTARYLDLDLTRLRAEHAKLFC